MYGLFVLEKWLGRGFHKHDNICIILEALQFRQVSQLNSKETLWKNTIKWKLKTEQKESAIHPIIVQNDHSRQQC